MNQKISLLLAVLLLATLFSIAIVPERELTINCENDQCLITLAKENNEPKYCSSSSNNSKCYYFLALHMKQPNLCNLEIDKNKCLKSYAISTGNKELCLDFEEKEQFDCILSYAVNRGELNVCNSIENSSYCIYSYTLYYNDPILCTLTGEYQSDCNVYFSQNGSR
jgi:hypothetical protein